MATSTPLWRCRQCLANGKTSDSKSAAHMKSHLATHGCGPWRCTGCNYIGRRREAVTAHHRAAGETGVGSYLDPSLNVRINQEVRECRLPHQNPWMGQSALPPHDQAARTAAVATFPPDPHTAPAPVIAPPVSQPLGGQVYIEAKRVDYLNATNKEADALDADVDWSSGSLTPLEASPSPVPPVVPDGRATKLSLRTIKVRASAIASEHIANLSNTDAEETYIVRAKAIDYLFHELYQLRTAFDHDNPASVIQKAIGSIIEILLWRRTLLSTAEDLETMKVDLKAIRLLKKAAKTAPLGDELRAQRSD